MQHGRLNLNIGYGRRQHSTHNFLVLPFCQRLTSAIKLTSNHLLHVETQSPSLATLDLALVLLADANTFSSLPKLHDVAL